MNNKYLRTRYAIVLIFVFTLVISCSFIESSFSSKCYKSDRHMLENNYGELLWSISAINVPEAGGNTMIAVFPDAVVGLVQTSRFSRNITAYATQTGEQLWSKGSKSLLLLEAGDNVVYVGGFGTIEVLDVMSGKILDSISLPEIGNITSFYHKDENFFISGSSGRFAVYDLENRVVTSMSEPNFTSTPLIKEGDLFYIREGAKIIAKNANDASVVWEYTMSDTFMDPIVTENMIFVRTGYSTFDGILYAINKLDGSLAWKSDLRVISNIVATASGVYFLATDGHLAILNPINGEERAKIEFSSPPFEMRYTDQELISGYFIDVNPENEIITVSFGDSCQLMTIRPQ